MTTDAALRPLAPAPYARMAAALAVACPDVDRLALDAAGLRALIASVVRDVNAAALSDDDLQAIKWTWMRYADEGFPAFTARPLSSVVTERAVT